MKPHCSNPRDMRERRQREAKLERAEKQELRHVGLTEAQLQTAVIKLARDLGWGVTLSARKSMLEEAAGFGVAPPELDGLIFHPRYSLGSEPGWPDLTLVRRRDRRLLFAELKSERGALSQRQAEVLELLGTLMFEYPEIPDEFPEKFPMSSYLGGVLTGLDKAIRGAPRIEVHVWRPADLASGRITEVLR